MMKYLTLDRWIADQDLTAETLADSRAAAEQYSAYLDSIRSKLPPALVLLLDEFTIHDARVRELHLSVEQRTLTIRLDAHDQAMTQRRQRYLRLQYRDVTEVGSTADPDKGLLGPHGYGDLGYDELELLSDGMLEHRFLFSSGIEIFVRFGNADLMVES